MTPNEDHAGRRRRGICDRKAEGRGDHHDEQCPRDDAPRCPDGEEANAIRKWLPLRPAPRRRPVASKSIVVLSTSCGETTATGMDFTLRRENRRSPGVTSAVVRYCTEVTRRGCRGQLLARTRARIGAPATMVNGTASGKLSSSG